MSTPTEHKEWRKENTLTAPSDKNPDTKLEIEQGLPPLTNEQAKEAVKELSDTSFVERFPAVERRYADPPIDMQKVGLISFVPAKGAKPNEKGVYGFAKLRGNYATPEEASERAEHLIRNVDSYHQIYHTFVGRPFPLTNSSDYSKEVERIDLRKETASAIAEDVKKKREKEQREIEEIKEREKELLEDVKKDKENIDDHYTTLHVKKAQLTWTFVETSKKLKQMVGLIAKARHEINVLDQENSELREKYMEKYIDARRRAGLPTDGVDTEESFMKYLVEDHVIPEVDAEYKRLYGEE
uniref:Uncharacterized protein n=1 Tax=viral metagenome TaxID=1070528 RepID=A0A6C0EK07_9ZZZZ